VDLKERHTEKSSLCRARLRRAFVICSRFESNTRDLLLPCCCLAGLTVGDPVLRTRLPLSAELGPGTFGLSFPAVCLVSHACVGFSWVSLGPF